VPSASRPITEGTPSSGTERDSDALVQAIGRVQAEARRDATLTQALSATELDLAVESIVRELWHDSPIKTFVPVLALRQTRDRLLIPMTE
jgi:hypothetical protein